MFAIVHSIIDRHSCRDFPTVICPRNVLCFQPFRHRLTFVNLVRLRVGTLRPMDRPNGHVKHIAVQLTSREHEDVINGNLKRKTSNELIQKSLSELFKHFNTYLSVSSDSSKRASSVHLARFNNAIAQNNNPFTYT